MLIAKKKKWSLNCVRKYMEEMIEFAEEKFLQIWTDVELNIEKKFQRSFNEFNMILIYNRMKSSI